MRQEFTRKRSRTISRESFSSTTSTSQSTTMMLPNQSRITSHFQLGSSRKMKVKTKAFSSFIDDAASVDSSNIDDSATLDSSSAADNSSFADDNSFIDDSNIDGSLIDDSSSNLDNYSNVDNESITDGKRNQ